MGFISQIVILYWIWIIVGFATHLVLVTVVYRDAMNHPQLALGISPFLNSDIHSKVKQGKIIYND